MESCNDIVRIIISILWYSYKAYSPERAESTNHIGLARTGRVPPQHIKGVFLRNTTKIVGRILAVCSGGGHRRGGEESGDSRTVGSRSCGRAALPQSRELLRDGDADDDEALRDAKEDWDDGGHDESHVQVGLLGD